MQLLHHSGSLVSLLKDCGTIVVSGRVKGFIAMKILSGLILLLVFGVYGTAQTSTPSHSDPEIVVLEKKWRVNVRVRSLERDIVQETKDREMEEERRRQVQRTNDTLRELEMPTRDLPTRPLRNEPATGPTLTYIYEVKVRNDSKKKVVSLVWEYVFLEPGTEQEVGRRRIESKVSIGAGRTRNLVAGSAIPPTGTVDAASTDAKSGERYLEKIVIVSVEYADGSRWPK